MRTEKDNVSESSSIAYHIHLVKLLATCTEGKNANTEIKCHSLLSLDDILRVVIHPDCMAEVSSNLFEIGVAINHLQTMANDPQKISVML